MRVKFLSLLVVAALLAACSSQNFSPTTNLPQAHTAQSNQAGSTALLKPSAANGLAAVADGSGISSDYTSRS